jgi:hypothetical protein
MSEVGELAARANALAEKVGELSLAVAQIGRRTDRSEKLTLAVGLGLALDLVLSAIVAFALHSLYEVKDREDATRQQALCPLYSLILGSYAPNTRPAGEERDKYEAAFVEMGNAYASLNCRGPLVPPRR